MRFYVLRAEEGSMPVPEGRGHFPDLAPFNTEASPSRRRGGLVVTSGVPIQRSRRLTAFTTATLRTAVGAYCSNPVTAEATYGAIAAWDTSAVEDMSYLFNADTWYTVYCSTASIFNGDLSA